MMTEQRFESLREQAEKAFETGQMSFTITCVAGESVDLKMLGSFCTALDGLLSTLEKEMTGKKRRALWWRIIALSLVQGSATEGDKLQLTYRAEERKKKLAS